MTAQLILLGRHHLSTRLIWRALTGNLGKVRVLDAQEEIEKLHFKLTKIFSIYSRKPENMAEALQLTESNFHLYLFVNLIWVFYEALKI